MKNIEQLGAIVSIPHMAMKFPTENGAIITMKVDHKETQQCYVQSIKVSPYFLVQGTTRETTTHTDLQLDWLEECQCGDRRA